QLGERGGRRAAGQAGADDDHAELALVGRADQLHLLPVALPLLGHGAGGDVRVELHWAPPAGRRTSPLTIAIGTALKPSARNTARPIEALRARSAKAACDTPRLRHRLAKPWLRCTARSDMATM